MSDSDELQQGDIVTCDHPGLLKLVQLPHVVLWPAREGARDVFVPRAWTVKISWDRLKYHSVSSEVFICQGRSEIVARFQGQKLAYKFNIPLIKYCQTLEVQILWLPRHSSMGIQIQQVRDIQSGVSVQEVLSKIALR